MTNSKNSEEDKATISLRRARRLRELEKIEFIICDPDINFIWVAEQIDLIRSELKQLKNNESPKS
jgi:hypothetical protein